MNVFGCSLTSITSAESSIFRTVYRLSLSCLILNHNFLPEFSVFVIDSKHSGVITLKKTPFFS